MNGPESFLESFGFREIKPAVRPDSRGRITLGVDLTAKDYRIFVNHCGQIVLDPVDGIPEREAWLWQSDCAKESLKRGLEQAVEGQTRSLGSFSEFADDDLD